MTNGASMQFPKWADSTELSKQQRASGRLKFITSTLATELSPRASMRALAEQVGLEHSTITKSIKQGFFSEKSAITMTYHLKTQSPWLTVEMLTSPMSIRKTRRP